MSTAADRNSSRLAQTVLIVSLPIACWLGMQAIHELGHVLAAWMTRGTVERVVFHPLTISRTDLADNPRPLIVVWGGPLFGVGAPLVAWMQAAVYRAPGAFLLRFFAGFCLIANGAYIAGGSLAEIGDCGEMLRHGAPIWTLWLFGLVTIPAGLALWNGQGRHFGIGPQREPVSLVAAIVTAMLCLLLIALGLLVGG